jgi:hypothetical protein
LRVGHGGDAETVGQAPSAIIAGLRTTDRDADLWYDYDVVGQSAARLSFARAHGDALVMLKVEIPTI